MIRWLRPLYTRLLPILFGISWVAPFLHKALRIREKGRSVLLVAQNSVAADHQRLVSELLLTFPDVTVHVTNDWFPSREFKKYDLVRMVKGRHIHITLALLRHWDLVVFSNHPFGLGIWFSPGIRKLYINHGLHIGKINNELGQDGVYGRSRVVRPFSQPYYDCMFASSDFERQLAVRETPELEGRVKVTGFLMADNFLQRVEEHGIADRSKEEMCSRDQVVVHIISTWGPQSLFHTMGRKVLEQAVSLTGKYRFIFSLHPRYDHIQGGMGESRAAILERYERQGITVNRGLDWERHVIGSDIAISDHSSLGLYHVLLGHPVLLANIDAAHYLEGSVFSLLSGTCPRLEQDGDLEEALESLAGCAANPDYSRVLDAMLSHRGQAAQRYREEMEKLLYQL